MTHLSIGSLFTGYAGLDMAVEQVTGARTVWHCENDPAASRLLAHRFPGVPNHGDITRVDWTRVEPVDIVTAGWPCQPFSQAGKRKGAADERALWPYVADAVRVVRPRLVFLENVPAIVTAGELARAVASLAALGYLGSWTCLRASDVGAPHRRERCFIVARDTDRGHRDGGPAAGLARQAGPQAGSVADTTDIRHERGGSTGGRRRGPTTPDAECGGRDWRAQAPQRGSLERAATAWTGADPVANTQGGHEPSEQTRDGRDRPVVGTESRTGTGDRPGDPAAGIQQLGRGARVAWGPYATAILRWEHVLGRVAPPPTEPGPKGGPRLSPRFVEWMQGLADGWVTDVPGVSRNDQLKMLGNGVVPQQGEAALRWLILAHAEAVAA